MSKQYLLKQIPTEYSENVGLHKYNRSRMPGCTDVYYAMYDDYTAEFLTGLTDEETARYSNPRINLEKTSNFWETFGVSISADKPKIFRDDNIMDIVAMKMLIANKYIAPDKESTSDEQYRNALYYLYTENEVEQEKVSIHKKADKAMSLLLKISDDKDKMVMYGQYLEGVKYSKSLSEDKLYTMLRSYITENNHKNVDNFLNLFNTPVDDIQRKTIIDKALKNKLVSKVKVDGTKDYVYQFGQVTIGNSIEEVYSNLSLPEYAPELASIMATLKK